MLLAPDRRKQPALEILLRGLWIKVVLQGAVPTSQLSVPNVLPTKLFDALDHDHNRKLGNWTKRRQEPSFLRPSRQAQKDRFGGEGLRKLQSFLAMKEP